LVNRGYAICTTPRSGSNFLCDLLTSTEVLGRPTEYFNGVACRRFEDPTYPDDPREQIRRVLTTGATANGVYALKLFPFQHDNIAKHVSWTNELPNLNFVYLERRDLLGQAISLARALQTRSWKSSHSATAEPTYSSAGIRRCVSLLVTASARWAVYFARNGIEPVHLVYEDVVERPQTAVDQIATLINLRGEPAVIRNDQVDLKKQRDTMSEEWRARFIAEHRHLDRIDNFGLVTAAAAGAKSKSSRHNGRVRPTSSQRVHSPIVS